MPYSRKTALRTAAGTSTSTSSFGIAQTSASETLRTAPGVSDRFGSAVESAVMTAAGATSAADAAVVIGLGTIQFAVAAPSRNTPHKPAADCSNTGAGTRHHARELSFAADSAIRIRKRARDTPAGGTAVSSSS